MSDEAILDTCGCCEGTEPLTPTSIENSPGLSAIAYRIGTHATFKETILAGLSRQRKLDGLTTRESDDPSIALVDAAATMLDVLTFYQERIANEGYLRTATERRSILELARSIGYELSPGVAASTYLAFELETAPGSPERVLIDKGAKVQSLPGPGEQPQTFETIEAIEARPAWNALKPQLSTTYLPADGGTDCYLQGTGLNLRPGDGLLFIGEEFIKGTDNTCLQFCLISTVSIDNDNQRTRVTWSTALSGPTPVQNPQVHVFRKKAAVFGHNAPDWAVMPVSVKKAYNSNVTDVPSTWGSEWPNFKISPTGDAVDLDAVYADVLPHSAQRPSWLVLTTGADPALFKVTKVGEVSRAAFAISAKVTRATLTGVKYATFEICVRETAVYAASEQLNFAEAPLTTAVSNDNVALDKPVEGLLPGRKLIVTGRVQNSTAEEAEVATLKSVTPEGTVSKLSFEDTLQYSYQRDTVTIHANVAKATHGETKRDEVLGSGQGGQPFQRFALKQKPITYVSAPTSSGRESTLEVRVNDIRWDEAPSLYARGPKDPVYIARLADDGTVSVQFGDGATGARLPTGAENVVATYRVGTGLAGLVKTNQLSLLMTRPLGVKGVANPLAPTGAADPEPRDQARRNAPFTVFTLDRIVSLKDYQDFALAFAGIGKAQAVELRRGETRLVHITVAAADAGRVDPASDLFKNLTVAIAAQSDEHQPFALDSYTPLQFNVEAKLRINPRYRPEKVLPAVRQGLLQVFSFEARSFGQSVTGSEVIAVMQRVEGVVSVDLDFLYFTKQSKSLLLDLRLKAEIARWDGSNTQPAELLTLNPNGIELSEVKP